MAQYLVIPKLCIHNANAMSSGYTIGFPAMTAWMGAVHALERKIQGYAGLENVQMLKTGISCHDCDMQLYKGKGDYKFSIIGTANPLKLANKSGDAERPAFIEEARCHLKVTLVIEMAGVDASTEQNFIAACKEELARLKIAGGDIDQDIGQKKIYVLYDTMEGCFKKIIKAMMPGYVLVSRKDLMLKDANADTLDNLLNVLKVQCEYQGIKDGKAQWHKEKLIPDGWLVPIVVGFKALTGDVQVANQRSQEYEHHFAEPLVTAGEFVMPYQFGFVDEFMWKYAYDEDSGCYLCVNEYNADDDEI